MRMLSSAYKRAAIAILGATLACTTASAADTVEGKDAPSLYQSFTDIFPIGAAVEPYQLEGAQAALLTRHFNSIVAENVMKPENIQGTEGNFDFSKADRLVAFAQKNKMKMRGHTLVWHMQTPAWFFVGADGKTVSKELLLARLKTHINTVMGRYKGKIYAWDVVNEAIEPNDPAGWRKSSKWLQILGPDYIEYAFRFAHEADPDAKLFYNDYDTTNPEKRSLIYNMIKRLKDKGVPIHGLGHQMHININFPRANDIAETLDKFAALGIDQQVTELDMSLYLNQTDDSFDKVPAEMYTRQAFRYKEVFDVFRKHKAQLTGVTFWSMADDHTWLSTWPKPRLDKPLLFDDQLRPKEAFWAVMGDASRMPLPKKQQVSLAATPDMSKADDASWNTPATIQSPLAKGQAFSVASAWSDGKLFLRIDVKAGKASKEEAIDLFIDPNNGKTATYESDDQHWVLFRDGRAVTGVEYRVFPLADGYRLLATLPVKTRLGKAIGFDARLKSADGSVSAWNDSNLNQDQSPANWGSLLLQPTARLVLANKGTPTIDGKVDAVWKNAPEIETTVKAEGNPEGARAKIKLLWDDSSTLYLLYTVKDDKLGKTNKNVWEQDSIEAFIDENNARTPAYDNDDAQFRINYTNEQSFAGSANAERVKSVATVIPGGYQIEVAIKLNSVKPKPGVIMGFDAQINDDPGTGSRGSVLIWNDPTGNTWQSLAKVGLLGFNP